MSGKQWAAVAAGVVLLVVVAIFFPVSNPSPRLYGIDPAEAVPIACILAAVGLGVWVVGIGRGYASVPGCAALVAVVAVAVLVLVAGKSVERNPQVSCLSNLKQLALGSLMYEEDYGRLPRARGWPVAAYAYVKNYGLYRCPSDKRRADTAFSAPGWSKKAWLSYGANMRLSGADTAKMPRPETVIWLFEADQAVGLPGMAVWRHRDKTMANFCFADGHVKLMSRQDLVDLRRPSPRRRR